MYHGKMNSYKIKEVITVLKEKKNTDIIMNNRVQHNNKPLSDEVIIEIVHTFKDIIIEFITRKYQSADNES